jgi:hypothetical protein
MIKSTKPRIKLPFVADITGSEILIDNNGEFVSTHKMLVVKVNVKNGKIRFTIKCNFEINETVETVQRLLNEANNGKANTESKL